MAMFDQPALENHGFYQRMPLALPRYYLRGPAQASRGSYASLHLLNLTSAQVNKTEDRTLRAVLQELSVKRSDLNRLAGMTSFLLQSVSYQDGEKTMVLPTFGDDFAVYFMGRAPRRMTISGVLIDDHINNWFYKFMYAYDKLLRGTALARYFRLVAFELHNASIIGVITGISYGQNAANDVGISFNIDFLVKSYQPRSSSEEQEVADLNNMLGLLAKASDTDFRKLTVQAPTAISKAGNLITSLNNGTFVSNLFSTATKGPDPKGVFSPVALPAKEEEEYCNAYSPLFQNMGAQPAVSTKTSILNVLKSAGDTLNNTRKGIKSIGDTIHGAVQSVHNYADPLIKTVQDTKRVIAEAKRLRGNISSFARTADKLIRSEAAILRSGKIGAITGGASIANIKRIINLGDQVPIVGAKTQVSVLPAISFAQDGLQNTSKFLSNFKAAAPAPSSTPLPTS